MAEPITLPELSLVVLVGASSAGKSTLARRCFRPTEVLSSDTCRALVADAEADQAATRDAFEILQAIAGKRLARGLMTVIDATNLHREDRAPYVELARAWHVLPVAIVFDVPDSVCFERNRARTERRIGGQTLRSQLRAAHRARRGLEREGFRLVHVLGPAEIDSVGIVRQRMWVDRRDETGPFDVVGDVHGCFDELRQLLDRLGYGVSEGDRFTASHPQGRRLVFLGDVVDRGPDVPSCLRLVMDLVAQGVALCVCGNHEIKLLRKLRGKEVRVSHGLASTLEQLAQQPPDFTARVAEFLDGLRSHYVLDGGRLVVAHAGLRAEMHGRASPAVREFALYGETTGEVDEFGLPVRYPWADDYRGQALVVYGHTPVPGTEFVNNTICIDTGCVFGGALTALRYPERTLVQVQAQRVWYEPVRPLATASTASAPADAIDLADVLGKRVIATRLMRSVTIRAENASAALEVMSRFAVDPRWLIYLPPTMSPCETAKEEGWLERPEPAFVHYRAAGVQQLVCQEKHMGSRAVLVVCRDQAAAARRFRVEDGSAGICYTRTGRRFFDDAGREQQVVDRVRDALARSGLFDELQTDWVCLDCELMPWSEKAQDLLRTQYAAVGSAARAGLSAAAASLEQAAASRPEAEPLLERCRARAACAEAFVAAYRGYCWPVVGLDDLRLAPFHLLAAEGRAFTDRDHVWHMQTLAQLSAADPLFLIATPYKLVDLDDEASCLAALRWWEELTARGGEGMVVKTRDFAARGRKGLVQPALKVRGREYLRIIYGPDYTLPEHLSRLRERGLGVKRSLALRELALGIEALERFVRHEPLRAVHECVFGVLALESEPVDPRL